MMLFSRESGSAPTAFNFLGRACSHKDGIIVGVQFGMKEGAEVLVSVGQDRKVVEYDLVESDFATGLQLTEVNPFPRGFFVVLSFQHAA